MKKLVIVGGGGHCKSVADCIISQEYADIIISDTKESFGKSVCGISVSATDEMLPELVEKGYSHAFIALGAVNSGDVRRRIYNKLCDHGYEIETIIDRSAVVSKFCEISQGVFIGKKAVVNAGAKIGCCTIINTGAIIEHDCVIGNFSNIAPGCTLSGAVTVGDNTHIGTGTSIKNGVNIGKNVIIGVGSAVVHNIPDDAVAYGVPCRVVK